ncbi:MULTISPECIES: autotransporter outer membrane beta-barrel domain-containing protein [Mesorhizobium]|uniref:autotransporter outer membrane beta-barrel domain-containing protein n=1 Tax=Mesorhizobium TaxID=68287 RepID=UPI0018DCCBAC|nr:MULTISPECIES: autotransporter outer membrane beta-barrel domain-containing protein [Mesorhizobium]WJI39910.1 autotransporter outer membrane beta-barrel domain-containing protein [Mesorhizobium opportunistum]
MAGRIHVRGGVLAVARGRFWAGASLAALVAAGMAPRQAVAGNYVANSEGTLRAAITAANADLDPNATVTLTASFAVSSTSLPTPTKPLTIDTQGFILFGGLGSGVPISGAGAARTLIGTFRGSDGGTSSAGLLIRNGAAVINMGLVQGGTGASGSGGAGVDFGGPGAATTLTNHGTIRGGPAVSGSGGIGVYVRSGTGQIINTGTIESGGPGVGAIAANAAGASIDIVNSGTIRAGTGANAIGWISSVTPTTGVISLELQDGSQIFGNVVANATATTDRLRLNGTGFSILDGSIGAAGQYRNFDIFEKTGSGTWALTADNTATTNWDIQQGTLQLGNDGTSGSIIGDVANAGTLAFDRSDAPTYGGTISGTGSVSQIGSGTTILTGANTYTGGTAVNAGKLVVEGSLGNTETTVNSGGTLGGSGSIGGAVIVADGGVLAPGSSPGTLTVGSLSLSSGSILDYELGQAGIVGGGVNDLIEVTGALTLDGSLNITDVGGFGPGVYRLINYGGALTDHGLELGNLPAGVTAADLTVQTSVNKQVNLISSVGTDLWFWDGDAAGNANNNLVDGGNGTWTATSPNWTTSTGLVNGAMKPQPGFAVFQTLGGTVVADDSAGALEVTGMQFAADGYRIEGDPVTLAGAGGESVIRVGDGTVAGAGYTATIASVLTGASSLTKTDAGTLVLSGANTYTGGTTVLGGVLSVAADNNLGAAAGALTLSGGTLRNTAAFESARGVILSAAGGTVGTAADLTLSGAISGAGSLAKTGAGTLTLTGTNSYGGNTLVGAGTLVGNAASIRGNIGNSGIVVFNQAADASFAGDISGTGAMVKDGAGTLTLSGTSLLDWTVDQGGLVAAAERFGGDVSIGAGASFTFDQTANASYAGVLSGAGNFVKDGLGTVVLASDNSAFAGATLVNGGTLAAGAANAFSSASQFSVASGATLDLAGTSQTIAGLTNAGTVGIAGSLGSKLTVSGDYVGNGGNILIGAALGADNSQTNMLVIAGGTSGVGTLQVVNLGGGGAQTVEGIKIVDVGGVSNGSFSLKGNYSFEGDQAVVGGAYAYRLYQGGTSTPGDGDWYLRSALIDGSGPGTPLYQAGAPLYEAYAGVLQTFNQLGTLQQRLGNRSWTVEAQGADGVSDEVRAEAGIGLWGRIEGTSGSYDPRNSTTTASYDTSTWKLQTGADMLLSDSAAGQLIGGVAFQYGTVSADVSSLFGSGSIDSTGTGVSGSLTWYGAEGFYLDSQAQVIWYDSDLDSATAGQRLVDGSNGVGYALGVEAGKRIMLDPSWSLTPQAQLAWSSVDLDAFTDAFGARVTPGSNDSLLGRLGLSLDHQSQWQDRSGRTGHTNVYTIANLYYDFEDGSSVDLAGSSLSSRNDKLWGGLGIGGTINWADDKFSVFGEAVARTGLENFGDSHALTGSLGLRVKW